jgi:hypothetical protein
MEPDAEVTNEEALAYPIRIMVLRDPFDRLESAYSFFMYLRRRGSLVLPEMPPFETYEQFVDLSLDSSDKHLAPQFDQVITGSGVFVPTHVERLEKIESWWPKYFDGLLPDSEFNHRKNRTAHLPVARYREADIRERYKQDFELCQAN